jgi:hypothetical protein
MDTVFLFLFWAVHVFLFLFPPPADLGDSLVILFQFCFAIEMFSGPSSYRRQRGDQGSVFLGWTWASCFHFLSLGSVLLAQLAVPASGSCSQFRVCRSDCFSRVTCRTPAEGSRFLLGLSITRQESSQVRAVFPLVRISYRSYCFATAEIRFGCGPFSHTGSLSHQLRFQVSVCIVLERAQEPFFSAVV